MAFDFNQISNQKLNEVKAVPLAPQATYRWSISKLAATRNFEAGDGTKYQVLSFPCNCLGVADDTDVSGYPGDITDLRMNYEFMFNTEDEVNFTQVQNQIKRFFIDVLKCCDEDATIKEGINNSVRQQFLANIVHRPDKRDPENFQASLGKAAPIA